MWLARTCVKTSRQDFAMYPVRLHTPARYFYAEFVEPFFTREIYGSKFTYARAHINLFEISAREILLTGTAR